MRTPWSLLALVALCLFVGCSTTKIVDSWTAPGLVASDLSFEHVVAIAALPDELRQRIVEDAIAGSTTRTKVTPAYTLLSQADRADVKRLRAVLERHGIDGAITLSLVRVEDKTRYVPGMTRTVPGGYYGYYGGMGTVVQEPGHYRTDTHVIVETSLYDLAEGKLLWAVVSSTLNPDSADEVIEGIAKAANEDLRNRGLIP